MLKKTCFHTIILVFLCCMNFTTSYGLGRKHTRNDDRGFYFGSDPKSEVYREIAAQMMDPSGGNITGLIRTEDYAQALVNALKYSAVGGVMTGMMDAVEKPISLAAGGVFNAVKDGAFKIWNVVRHGKSLPVSQTDLQRWALVFKSTTLDLPAMAEKAKQSGHIQDNMGQIHLPDGMSEPTVQPTQNSTEVDQGWLQNLEIFRKRLLQMVLEIDNRIEFYSAEDEIVSCLIYLKIIIVGTMKAEATKTDAPKKKDFTGGVYGCIVNAPNLASIANTNTKLSLKLFANQAKGVLSELTHWVSAKSSKNGYEQSFGGDSADKIKDLLSGDADGQF